VSKYFNGATASTYAGYYGAGPSVTVAATVTLDGTYFGISLSAAGTVTGTGIYLAAGGSLSNLSGGLIKGAAGTIGNSGTIIGTSLDGVGLFDGGTLTNGSTSSAGALVEGMTYGTGIDLQAGGSVTNGGSGHAGALIGWRAVARGRLTARRSSRTGPAIGGRAVR
jgi:hypothetical protein